MLTYINKNENENIIAFVFFSILEKASNVTKSKNRKIFILRYRMKCYPLLCEEKELLRLRLNCSVTTLKHSAPWGDTHRDVRATTHTTEP